MKELDDELWKLGIPSKTRHNEAAPMQHELAVLYTQVNISCDNNELIMEVMKKLALKHGFVCLLHEKPFAGVNGSGTIGFTDELGCDLYVSNQLATEDNGTVHLMAGSYSAIAYAEQVLDIQYIDRLENSFDSAVRGRIVFGAKVIKPEELVDVPVTDGGNEI